MISIGYRHDGETTNVELEDFLDSEMGELGFADCSDVYGLPEMVFEVADKNLSHSEKHEKQLSFMNDDDEQRSHIESMVGHFDLRFNFVQDEEETVAPLAPATVGNGDKKMQFFGWCSGTDSDGKKHDKIWGVISAQGQWITFWGARGKKLSFKRSNEYASGDSLETMIRGKRRKDYRDTTMQEMNALDPEFETRFEEHLILCLMADQFHQTPSYA